MSEEEQEKKGFRVVDKRRFNSEGETRTDVPERPDPPAAQVPPPSRPRAAAPGQPADPRAAHGDPRAAEDPRSGRDPRSAHDPRSAEDPRSGRDPRSAHDPRSAEDPRSGRDPRAAQGDPRSAHSDSRTGHDDPRSGQDPRSAPQPAEDPRAAAAQDGGIDFISFIASLATNALASLGALPEARAQGVPVSLEMAREYIEIIGMLAAKTRGNLSREEEASLQRIISELRMVYVEVTQRIAKGPPQPGRH
jgi:hypothetical protein